MPCESYIFFKIIYNLIQFLTLKIHNLRTIGPNATKLACKENFMREGMQGLCFVALHLESYDFLKIKDNLNQFLNS